MPAILLVVLAFLLGGCVTRDPLVSSAGAVPSGNWRIERQMDRVTGGPLSSAFLVTQNSSSSAIAFTQPAQLQLGCFKDKPIVRLTFRFKVGSTKNAELGYRFDEKPGREPKVRFVEDYKTVVIEDKADVAQFVNDLATSSILYLRIRSLNAGRSSAEFSLNGAPAAIEAALADCPVSPTPGRPAARTSERANHRRAA